MAPAGKLSQIRLCKHSRNGRGNQGSGGSTATPSEIWFRKNPPDARELPEPPNSSFLDRQILLLHVPDTEWDWTERG